MESEVALCFFSPSQPLVVMSSQCSARRPARLILKLLSKTQIKSDNEESFSPLRAAFICFDCYSEPWMAVLMCTSVLSGSGTFSLRSASLVVKQNHCAQLGPVMRLSVAGGGLGSSGPSAALQNIFYGRSVVLTQALICYLLLWPTTISITDMS